ncbi:glutathione transferase GstA [Halomonas sp. ANAO-440]|uniref:glutathione transferase GstA n=1 Tax=Halomonas sp. ANAO-440 TaxID=2861360 RepID=UPI001CAA5CBA|nr:glutathione transferase GstA [Halomonas sp. ANAO-440]MBZ0331393.1 glutathione transferase GstA [Halomonas sp. ANAO-440]
MKLFYKAGACSLASHIALREVGAEFQLEAVDTQRKMTETGTDYRSINPKGYVPALVIGSDVLTEGAAILQFIADTHPLSNLAPDVGTIPRARLQEHLNYVASELHKAFGPFFRDDTTEKQKEYAAHAVATKFDYIETLLSDDRSYLLGDGFTVADAYLFVVANWANFVGIDLKSWPYLASFVERVAARPAVQDAMVAEGLTEQ